MLEILAVGYAGRSEELHGELSGLYYRLRCVDRPPDVFTECVCDIVITSSDEVADTLARFWGVRQNGIPNPKPPIICVGSGHNIPAKGWDRRVAYRGLQNLRETIDKMVLTSELESDSVT